MKNIYRTVKTKEPHNQSQVSLLEKKGPVFLGATTSYIWRTDPRHLGFLLARYKFCAKMLSGKSKVLEVGCGDGFGVRVVLQEVKFIHALDFDPFFIRQARQRARHEGLNCVFSALDITREAPKGKFEAVYALDFIEHIKPQFEGRCMENISAALEPHGICIIGTPNITAKTYASGGSALGHINLKSAESLKKLLLRYFYNVFIFSMNDEIVHTGFYPMANYLFGLGVEVRK